MDNWKQIKPPQDPDWIEWYQEIMTPAYGRVMLNVWQRMDNLFEASLTEPNDDRVIRVLDAANIEDAKQEALDWAKKR